ncbi:hypothetical protein AWJ20_4484 [Sugiyamaella lignohabitans]|uniref:Ribosome assembly protein 3 n=1 Tax=Sugiyamaella lignohabitans TaxID=796027 RepID=A0A167CGL8_9ASCO|nr:uncharacterized protein AWJ20_4484 [Sugiyamaella lignohabitans]ANB11663.1 hypothetical protein AWJ20_4484 [Sugiyamaella lignohabitans]
MNIDGEEETAVSNSTAERPVIPDPLKTSASKSEFEDYYVQMMTEKFGDDLNKLRQSNDFQPKSLFMLINALKEGVNIFDADQQKIILSRAQDEHTAVSK